MKTPTKFASLSELRDFLHTLETQIQTGAVHSAEIDFVPVFTAFQDLIDERNLPESVTDFKHSSDSFQNKIDEIKAYISRVTEEDEVIQFLNKNAENDIIFGGILNKCWKRPLVLEKMSEEYLLQSFNRCANRAERSSKQEYQEPLRIENRPEVQITALEEPFEDSLMRFFTNAKDLLPCTLKEILVDKKLEISAYERFIYCLHLIQKKQLLYNKKDGVLTINE